LSRRSLSEEYLRWLAIEKGRSPRTLEAYRSDLESFLAWVDEHSLVVSSLSESDLTRYIVERRNVAAASSVGRSVSVLRGFFGFLADEGVIAIDPASAVSAGRRRRSLPHPIPEPLLTAFLDGVNGTKPVDQRDRALLEFLYGTGARVSEAVAVRIQDLDFDEETIRLFGKGSKQRLVPMGAAVRRTLTQYLETARPTLRGGGFSPNVFLNARGGGLSRQGIDLIIRRRGLELGVPRQHLHAHAFRHSCATHMLEHGADIRSVQELLGHASIATTQVYTAVSLRSLHEAYRVAHPRAQGMT